MPTSLTPVKIPGKRKQNNSGVDPAVGRSSKRRPGRPLKPLIPVLNESGPGSGCANPDLPAKRNTLAKFKSKRRSSHLENLPVELLEKVFLYCMNFDLPRASPIISGKLSSESIYIKILLSAFKPIWDRAYGREGTWGVDHYDSGDAQIQSAILRCRWASLSIILKANEIWVQKYDKDTDYKPLCYIKGYEPPSRTSRDGASPAKMTAEEYFNIEFEAFSESFTERDGDHVWEHCSWRTNFDAEVNFEIPNSLLVGPWSEETIRYMFWVAKSGAHIGWIESTSGESALIGLKNAVKAGDTRAIHLLAWVGLLQKLDIDMLLWVLRNAGGDKIATTNQILRLAFSGFSDGEIRRVRRELRNMRDEAEQEADDEKLLFVKEILNCRTFHGRNVEL